LSGLCLWENPNELPEILCQVLDTLMNRTNCWIIKQVWYITIELDYSAEIPMNLNRNFEHFPFKNNVNFQAYCSVSPLCRPAADRAKRFIERQQEIGRGVIFEYSGDQSVLTRFHRALGGLMKTSPENISTATNTSEALSMIANGYPFEPGDQIISYIHEYPANHYPWVVQARRRCVELILLSDVEMHQESRPGVSAVPGSFARSWSLEELESKITDRTRVVALSHVQFTSGYAADLRELGALCRERGIDLVIDAAQSLGCLPVYPEEHGIACVAASGWKWLLGPLGSSVMFTSPEFRKKIEITMTGADQMHQGAEYLDHSWNPCLSGKKFEYSTASYALVDGLAAAVEEVFLPNNLETIWQHNLAMQELALSQLDLSRYQPIVHLPEHRSGILSLIPKISDAKTISAELDRRQITITPRDGYLRFAPHLCTTENEVIAAAEALNAIRQA
jgi:selenocysteine lyase/cysteine desulfurase